MDQPTMTDQHVAFFAEERHDPGAGRRNLGLDGRSDETLRIEDMVGDEAASDSGKSTKSEKCTRDRAFTMQFP